MRQIGFVINRDGEIVAGRATLEGKQLMKFKLKCKAKDINHAIKIMEIMQYV